MRRFALVYGNRIIHLAKDSGVPKHPLAEIFGYPADNFTPEADRHRHLRLCPFNNKSPNCTKDKVDDPIGVCSVFHSGGTTITCPVRFREHWRIVSDAATFFFPPSTRWTSLPEVRLNDAHGKSAGNIDVVLVSYDTRGRIIDFGSLEVQAVYISGNIRTAFASYMAHPPTRYNMDWSKERNYPRPDFLSSSRKRLAPQLMFKGGILHGWQKKQAVAVDRAFFATLPMLPEVSPEQAEIIWLIYDLLHDATTNRYILTRIQTVYTTFEAALTRINVAEPPPLEDFMRQLQRRFDAARADVPAGDATPLLDVLQPTEPPVDPDVV